MAKLSKIWSSKISRKKIRIYGAYVQNIMLFGCDTWEMDKGMEQSIDFFNRRMIRQACGIFWPNRMSTEKVNILAEPASQILAKRRWQMLGHFLWMNDQVSAKRATMEGLASKNTKRGRPSISLLTTIRKDLIYIYIPFWELSFTTRCMILTPRSNGESCRLLIYRFVFISYVSDEDQLM